MSFYLLVLKIPYRDYEYFNMQHSIHNNEAQCFSFLNANLSEIDKLNIKLFCEMNLNIYYYENTTKENPLSVHQTYTFNEETFLQQVVHVILETENS